MMSSSEIVKAVAALPRRPAAVQALWDGDSTGWMICIAAVHAYGPSHGTEEITLLRGDGGDMRVINGQVPPWPEAQIAAEAGLMIEKLLKIPFFFPAPEWPEDGCPNWWDRHLAKPCRSCNTLLLQEETTPWFGSCYHCHLQDERSGAKGE